MPRTITPTILRYVVADFDGNVIEVFTASRDEAEVLATAAPAFGKPVNELTVRSIT